MGGVLQVDLVVPPQFLTETDSENNVEDGGDMIPATIILIQRNRLRGRDVHTGPLDILEYIMSRMNNLSSDSYQRDSEADRIALEFLDSMCPLHDPFQPTAFQSGVFTSSTCNICFGSTHTPYTVLKLLSTHLGKEEANFDDIARNVSSFLLGNVRMLPCKHAFHSHCIDPWLIPRFDSRQYNFDCPICRSIIE